MSIDTSKVASSNGSAPADAKKPSRAGAVATWADERLGLGTAMKDRKSTRLNSSHRT